jgi:two-component system OmpR family sensor kinase
VRLRLGWKLGLTYILVVVIAMLAFGYLILQYFEQSFVQERKNALYSHANIIANQAVPLVREGEEGQLAFLVRDYAGRIGHRLILLNAEGRTVADSAGEMDGELTSIFEVRQALAGKSSASVYHLTDFGQVLYLTVPITTGKNISGVVFLAADVNDIFAQLGMIRLRLIWIGLISSGLTLLVSLLLARIVTVPVERLSTGVQRMAAGEYGYRIEVKGNDELSELGQAFNEMSQKIKEEDEVRKQFIANASHELRSPLASLRASLESFIIQRPGTMEELFSLLPELNQELKRLSELVDDLLLLSKIKSNRGSLQLENISVREILEEVRKKVQPLAQKRKVDLVIEGPGGLYWFLDGEKVYRVVYNLADNAVKYSPPLTTVIIRYYPKEDHLVLEVIDQGQGIPPEERTKVFERFYRLGRARDRKTGGTGLGLAIVKEIVDLHGGQVAVKENSDRGTCLSVVFPSNDTEDHYI